jgi:glucan 1,3-beta-glucosidase
MKLSLFLAACCFVYATDAAPPLPIGPPLPPPDYMVDNQGNQFGKAPDKAALNGPIIAPINKTLYSAIHGPSARPASAPKTSPVRRQTSDYWLVNIQHGVMPYAPSNYTFFRNVMDYGAKGDGVTDDTAAINRAASDGNRCGQACGSTSTLGALVYFPPGTYMISTPIIQYYYTQFVGDPNNRPTIQGFANFSGIALIDTDVYIPGGNGTEWYINQNQFYRQIRNFVLDLTLMPRSNTQGDQTYAPTGIHWQVAQATSLQNIHFQMPVSDASGATTAVGIFMENGSGGFVSDLSFFGGNIGFRAGSQQFTASNLQFTSCLTAISMIWDWGFTWKNINVLSCYIALDCTNYGGLDNQGTGSISVVDSVFNGVPYAITVNQNGPKPNIVIDNLLAMSSQSIVLFSGGDTILPG